MTAGGPPPAEVNPFAAPQALDLPPHPLPREAEFRSTAPLATAIMVVMGLMVLLDLALIANHVVAIEIMNRVQAHTPYEKSELTAIDARAGAGATTWKALYLVAAALFCFFMPRANRNVLAFGGGPLQFTPGWAAGVFFVPIWNLYKPYRAMKEIWQGSAWGASVSSLLPWWWGAFLFDRVFQATVRLEFKHVKGPADFAFASYEAIFGSALSIVAAVLAAVVVRRVAECQDLRHRAAAAPPGAHVPG